MKAMQGVLWREGVLNTNHFCEAVKSLGLTHKPKALDLIKKGTGKYWTVRQGKTKSEKCYEAIASVQEFNLIDTRTDEPTVGGSGLVQDGHKTDSLELPDNPVKPNGSDADSDEKADGVAKAPETPEEEAVSLGKE